MRNNSIIFCFIVLILSNILCSLTTASPFGLSTPNIKSLADDSIIRHISSKYVESPIYDRSINVDSRPQALSSSLQASSLSRQPFEIDPPPPCKDVTNTKYSKLSSSDLPSSTSSSLTDSNPIEFSFQPFSAQDEFLSIEVALRRNEFGVNDTWKFEFLSSPITVYKKIYLHTFLSGRLCGVVKAYNPQLNIYDFITDRLNWPSVTSDTSNVLWFVFDLSTVVEYGKSPIRFTYTYDNTADDNNDNITTTNTIKTYTKEFDLYDIIMKQQQQRHPQEQQPENKSIQSIAPSSASSSSPLVPLHPPSSITSSSSLSSSSLSSPLQQHQLIAPPKSYEVETYIYNRAHFAKNISIGIYTPTHEDINHIRRRFVITLHQLQFESTSVLVELHGTHRFSGMYTTCQFNNTVANVVPYSHGFNITTTMNAFDTYELYCPDAFIQSYDTYGMNGYSILSIMSQTRPTMTSDYYPSISMLLFDLDTMVTHDNLIYWCMILGIFLLAAIFSTFTVYRWHKTSLHYINQFYTDDDDTSLHLPLQE